MHGTTLPEALFQSWEAKRGYQHVDLFSPLPLFCFRCRTYNAVASTDKSFGRSCGENGKLIDRMCDPRIAQKELKPWW